MKRLQDKVAIVTGGSQGIGAAIVQTFVDQGARVAFTYHTRDDLAAALVYRLGGETRVFGRRADVREADALAAFFAEVEAQYGPANVLVNNAGVYSFGPIRRFEESEYRRLFDTNVLGVLNGCRLAAQQMGQGGSVINIGSAAATLSEPWSALYASSKAAVNTITVSLSRELGPRGIRVNAICPGVIDTENGRAAGATVGDYVAQTIASTPLGRLGTVEDVADVALFLASEESRWLTGECILASGGKR